MNRFVAGFVFALSITTPADANAHHSFATHYLMDQPMVITGTVSEFNIRSPHSFLMVDVENEAGEIERWEVEAHAVALMRRLGIEANTIEVGDVITVRGPSPRQSGKRLTFGGVLTLEDGTQFTLLESLQANLNREIVQTSAVEIAADATILELLNGRWGRSSDGGSGSRLGDSPLPLNQAGLDARAAFDPRDTPAMRCISPGLPSLLYTPYLYEIQANEQGVTFHHEYQAVFRSAEWEVETFGPDPRELFGTRTARLDGDTLIVESYGFPADAAGLASDWDPNGLGANVPSSEQKRLTERYTVSDDGQRLNLEYSVVDPVYLTSPYEARIEWRRLLDDAPIYDFECDVNVATQSTLNAPAREPSD